MEKLETERTDISRVGAQAVKSALCAVYGSGCRCRLCR